MTVKEIHLTKNCYKNNLNYIIVEEKESLFLLDVLTFFTQ